MTGDDKNDKDLNDYLSGADGLSKAYQQNTTELPPEQTDEAILAASRIAVNSRPMRVSAPFSSRWHIPVSIAAVMVLSVLVVINLPDENDRVLYEPAIEEISESIRQEKSTDMNRDEFAGQTASTPEAEIVLENFSNENVSPQRVFQAPQSADFSESSSLRGNITNEAPSVSNVREESMENLQRNAADTFPAIDNDLTIVADQLAPPEEVDTGRQLMDDSDAMTSSSENMAGNSVEVVVTAQRRAQQTECTIPRPEVCSEIYMPVCAVRDTGIRCVTTPCDSTETVDYPNACSACSDPDVISYTEELCEVPENEEDQL